MAVKRSGSKLRPASTPSFSPANGGRAVVTPVSATVRPLALAIRRAVASAEWRPWLGPMPTVEKRLTSSSSE